MNITEYRKIMTGVNQNKTKYIIEYETAYSKGYIEIDTFYYNKVVKKFNKYFKDCKILSLREVEK